MDKPGFPEKERFAGEDPPTCPLSDRPKRLDPEFPMLPPRGAPGKAGKSSVAILKFGPPADPRAFAMEVPITRREKSFPFAPILIPLLL
jgi:hypothetical protein